MFRRLSPILLAIACVMAFALPVAAAPGASAGRGDRATADHLGGAITACGRIVEFTAPIMATTGSLTVSGIVGTEDHAFVIDQSATVDPLVAGLATSGDWTCLALTGDGMGVLVDVAVAGTVVCAPLAVELDIFILGPGSTDAFTTVVLDGEAGVLIAGDADLSFLLASIAMTPGSAEVCLEFGLGAGGEVTSILLDYAEVPGTTLPALISCGLVDGTPLAYRDPASQPYPEGTEISVDGFAVDATLVPAPFHSVLAFHLDATEQICLLALVEDTVIVAAEARNQGDTTVCGELEVVGGLVNVDAVVVSQGLTGINFAEPSPESIASACWAARALPGGVDGLLQICGDFEGATDDTFTVSGVTFHLETAIDDSALPPVGGPQGIALIGPDPFEPFGAGNPARLTTTTLAGCSAAPAPTPALPDTAQEAAGTFGGVPVALVAVGWLVAVGVTLGIRFGRRAR